jgi:hypothetical protein
MKTRPLLVRALAQPCELEALAPSEWDLLVRQAAHANMLATLYYLCEESGVLQRVPARPREHLDWARMLAERHRRAVLAEVRQIHHALCELGLPLILLKGAAYTLAGLPAAAGRLFSDIDILVPEDRLSEVEAALMLAGWRNTHHDAYDQRYYREWMHELPPMQHLRRETVIDVHHAILPRTAAEKPDPVLLRSATVEIGPDHLRALAPTDMVLHSAVHLFSDGEFAHGLRDLFDLHRLLGDFGSDPHFWEALVPRAETLQLQRYLYYALRYTQEVFGTPVPAATLAATQVFAPALPAVMDALFHSVFRSCHPSCHRWFDDLAAFALYVRGNWLRMPPWRLARHLLRKAFLSPKREQATT